MSGKSTVANLLVKPSGTRTPETSSEASSGSTRSLVPQHGGSQSTEPKTQGRYSEERPQSQSMQAPPAITVPRTRSPQEKPPRSIGVHSMLNPTQPEPLVPRNNLRRSAAHLEAEPPAAHKPRLSSSSSLSSLKTDPASLPDAHGSSHGRFHDGNQQDQSVASSPERKIISLGPSHHLSRGAIDAKQSPFLSPRATFNSNVQRTTSVPDLGRPPSPPSRLRPSLSFSSASAFSSAGGGRSGEPLPISTHRGTSPPASYPSYGQAPHTSPAIHSAPPSFPPYTIAPGNMVGSGGSIPGSLPSPTLESQYGSMMVPSAQSGYQLMTLETDQGPIQVPVDVQAASRVADEKRRRNAGASARFRQRRKEKEREASQTISKLEQQVRDLAEDADFYRQERDYFRQLAYNASGKGQLIPRPASPRQRRMLQSSGSVASGIFWQADQARGESERGRRRSVSLQSSSYAGSPPIPSVVTASVVAAAPPPGLPPPSTAPSQSSTYGRAVLPPETSDHRPVAGLGPVMTLSAPPNINPYETYGPKPSESTWHPGPGR